MNPVPVVKNLDPCHVIGTGVEGWYRYSASSIDNGVVTTRFRRTASCRCSPADYCHVRATALVLPSLPLSDPYRSIGMLRKLWEGTVAVYWDSVGCNLCQVAWLVLLVL